jgi:hypothetical protein
VLTHPIRAIHDIAQLQVRTKILSHITGTLVPNAPPDVRRGGDPSAAGEEHKGGPPRAHHAAHPRLQEGEGRGVKRRRVRDGVVLPRPSSCLQRQSRDVVELGELEEGSAPRGRIVVQRLREVPGRPSHDQEMVVAFTASPYAGAVVLEKIEQFEAVVGAGIDVGAVEVTEGVDGGVVREIDGVGGTGIGGEARVLEHAAVEDEFEHERVGAEPAAGERMGLLAEAVVGKVGAEIVEERVLGAVEQEIQIEPRGQPSDVDPTASAVLGGLGNGGFEEEEEEEEGGGENCGCGGHRGGDWGVRERER